MPETVLLQRPKTNQFCISFIGMAGSGKTTIGTALANELGWAFMDTDSLIEAAYGVRLQDVSDRLGKADFLDMEAQMILSLRPSRCVIATGGSVVYRKRAMQHLRSIGPVVCLDAPFLVIKERISHNPERGLAIGEGQTLEDLYVERKLLYEKYADWHCDATLPPSLCAEQIAKMARNAHPECFKANQA